MSMKMSLVSLNQQNNHGIMDEKNIQDSMSYPSCSSEEASSNYDLSNSDNSELFGEEEGDEGNSSTSSISSDPSSAGSSHEEHTKGALQTMSSLLQELPFKRGLSKHYDGKSQSFTSLSNVSSLEDLAKPENPYNKKLKSCKSYGVMFLEGFKSEYNQPPSRSSSSSRLSSKKTSKGSFSSLRARRNGSFLGNNRPPAVPPHRSASTTSFTNQAPLFA